MKRGFTLIELMIVISVMAILMGIALPYFKGMQDEGNSAKAAGELRTLATALESFNIHSITGYPKLTGGAIVTLWQDEPDSITTAKPTIVKIKLMDAFKSTQEYSYGTSPTTPPGGAAPFYVVYSVGPDGSPDITAISDTGELTKTSGGSGVSDDDVYFSNGPDGNSF